ncbi:MAG: GtrA family protein [Rhodoglobus sp.]|nr:GtrA family protein [Rhodoglobus sp.]
MIEAPADDEQGEPGLLLRVVKDQRVAFVLVGGSNTALGFFLFIVADQTVGRWLDEVANTIVGSLVTLLIAHVIGVIVAFFLYRRFVFIVHGHVLRDLVRFESVYLVSLAINAVALPTLVEFGWNRILAQGVILAVTTVISYIGHRYFSFRRPTASVDELQD